MKSVSSFTGTMKITLAMALAIIGWGAICGVANAQTAGPVYPTTGVYDESVVATNSVDKTAVGSNITLDQFKTDMSTAYTNNTGGVVTFDLVVAPSELTTRFFATYGQSNQFLFTVTRNDPDGVGGLNSNNDNGGSAGVLSGSATTSNYLGNNSGSNYDIYFNPPLVEYGISALSRTSGARRGQMTLYFDTGAPYIFPAENIAVGLGVDDTFFGYKVTDSRVITRANWTSFIVGTDTPDNGQFVRWDDMGFSTSSLAPCDVDGLNGCTPADADLIRQNLLVTGASRGQGDLTGDGIVNLLDFKLWKSLAPGSGSAALETGAVPEPTSLAMLLLGVVCGIGLRRTRR